jgi:O-antigen/teichoic acid export membrane protein
MTEKQPETSKSVFRNVIYSFLTWFLPLILSFVATPVIIKSLGDKEYGIYALVLGFISYSFNLSFGRAVTKYIAEFRVKGENEKINEVISAAFWIALPIGLLCLAAIFLFAGWFAVNVFLIAPDLQPKTVYALYLAGTTIFLMTITQVFYAILQGLQRFDVYSKIFNFYNISLVLGNLFLALKDFGLTYLFGWNVVVTFLACLFYFVAAKKLFPQLKFKLNVKRESFMLVLNFSWSVIGYQLISNFLLLFERSWITRKLGTESLTIYVVPMMLAVYLHSFIASLTMVVFPLASELDKERKRLLRLYHKATKIVVMLVVFAAMILILEGKNFLTLWINADFAGKADTLLTIHTLTFGLTAVTVVAWYMTEGLGYPNYNFGVFMICFIISITGMLWLTESYGNFGVAIARLAGFSVIFFSVFYIEKRFFGKIQLGFWAKVVSVVGASALVAGIVNKLLISYFSLSWGSFVLATFVSSSIYLACLWFLKFLTEDEKLIFRRIFNL